MSESHIFDSPQWAFIALLGISALSLPACQSGRPPADTGAAVLVERVNRLEPAVNGPMSVEYHCSGNYVFHAVFEPQAVVLLRPEGEIRLEAVHSASGAKYAGAGVVFWTKGQEATLETREQAFADCAVVGATPP